MPGPGGGGLVRIPVILTHRSSCWHEVLMHMFYGDPIKVSLQMRSSD